MGFPEDKSQVDPFKQGRIATGDVLSRFSSREDLLNSQSEMQRNDAFELLDRALNNAPQVSAQQGIAAALLAAIPTLGGALIGRAVGSNKIPQGMYGVKGIEPIGMSAGGAMGAEIGNKASQGFLKRLDRTAETTPILAKMADIRNQEATQLAQQANQVGNARLQAEQEMSMIPLREASSMRVNAAQAKSSLANALEIKSQTDAADELTPEGNRAAAAALGLPPDKTYTTKELRVITAAKVAARQQQGQDFRQAETKGAESVDGAYVLPGFNPSPPQTKEAQKALANYNLMSRIAIPGLKQAFTDPSATLEQKNAAIAKAIVIIKKQEEMGANFTVMENELIKAGLPRIATLDVSSAIEATKAALQGQDILGKINKLEEIAGLTVNAQVNPYGYGVHITTNKDSELAAIDEQIAALEAQLRGSR